MGKNLKHTNFSYGKSLPKISYRRETLVHRGHQAGVVRGAVDEASERRAYTHIYIYIYREREREGEIYIERDI